jgi:hypothetical protein
MISYTFADPMVRQHSRLIQRLALDLERIRSGAGPTCDELEDAPLIDEWQVGVRAQLALVGNISGHPAVSGAGITSDLHILDVEGGYARTLSRFYRLGRRTL